MTSPLVDRVRDIPLIIERDTMPMNVDDEHDFMDDSGFPFDRPTRRADHSSVLDDIAKRHPEFAEHLEGFSGTGRRNRTDTPPRFTDRPFGSRFDRFGGFPFDRDTFFEDDFPQHSTHPAAPQQQQFQQQQQHSQSEPNQNATSQNQNQAQQSPSQEVKTDNNSNTSEEKTQKETPLKSKHIQQSNTVDLGQKQEPINDRNQRSMSAPPTDNRGQQRFVSSINIPINREGRMGEMGAAQAQPQNQSQPQSQPQASQQPQSSANRPTERVIPIHVEGRDEPVIPKHTGPSFAQAPPQPQPETIFGHHRPSHFQQFVNREPQRQFSAGATPSPKPQKQQQQQPFQEQQQQYQQQQQQKFEQEKQQPQQQKQEVPQEQPEIPQKPKIQTPIEVIQAIQKDVSELMQQVENFQGKPRDKQYLYLDEMLTRNLIKLDNVDTQGQENIRLARKEAIKCIQTSINILEAKAAANVGLTKPNQESEAQPPSEEKMETEPVTSTTNDSELKPDVQELVQPNEIIKSDAKSEEVQNGANNEAVPENVEGGIVNLVKTQEKMEIETAPAQSTTPEVDSQTQQKPDESNTEKKKGKKKSTKKD